MGIMTVTIYHNPRCSKSRAALSLLKERGIEPEVVEYLDAPPSVKELREIVEKLGMRPRDLLRRGEAVYKQLELKDEALSDEALLVAMAGNPVLIERPIVVSDKGARLGRPAEDILDIL